MRVGEIVTVMTTTGEYVGKLESDSESVVRLSNPRMIVMSEKGMGFASGIAMTGVEEPKSVVFYSIVFMTPTNEPVKEAWQEHTSSIVLPKRGGIIGA